MDDVVVIGAGGLGREVMEWIKDENKWNILGFIDDNKKGMKINGFSVLGGIEWFEENDAYCVIAVGNPKTRKEIVKKLPDNTKFRKVIHPSTIISDYVEIGDDVVICPRCIISPNVKIGSHVFINMHCIVAHDDIIEDYCVLSPSAKLMGFNHLHEGAYVGTGATFINGDKEIEGKYLEIGEWSVVGAGAVVIKDVSSYATVVGVPAKVVKIEKQSGKI